MMLWTENPMAILFDSDKLFYILPDPKDPLSEQINTFTRFLMWYGVILSAYKRSWQPILIAALCALLVVVVAKNYFKLYTQTANHATGWIVDEDGHNTDGLFPCAVSTRHNPFANPILGTNTIACRVDYDNPDVSQAVEEAFNHNLPLNEWDVTGRGNSQRQFFTTIHNDQSKFANWLYNPDIVCRKDPLKCMSSYGN